MASSSSSGSEAIPQRLGEGGVSSDARGSRRGQSTKDWNPYDYPIRDRDASYRIEIGAPLLPSNKSAQSTVRGGDMLTLSPDPSPALGELDSVDVDDHAVNAALEKIGSRTGMVSDPNRLGRRTGARIGPTSEKQRVSRAVKARSQAWSD